MSHRALFVSVAALALGQSSASAEFLFGVEYSGPTALFDVNQSTGALTSIGPTGRDQLGDLTSDPRNGSFRLWANRITSNELVLLNPVTGAEISAVAMDSPDNIVSIAFDTVTGKLYGNTSVGYGAPFEALYEIDPSNGATTFIGRIIFDNVYALGFDQAGELFGVSDFSNELISISTASGNGTFVAGVQFNDVFDIASRPSDGVMFATDTATNRLYQLDTSNGNMIEVGQEIGGVQGNLVGLAFGPIPAPGTAAILALGGIAATKRRRIRG